MLVNTACMQMRGPTPRRQSRSHSIKFHPGVWVYTMCLCVCDGGGGSNFIWSCKCEEWRVRSRVDRQKCAECETCFREQLAEVCPFLVFLIHLAVFLQMLCPQKKHNIETLQAISIFCTGRLQRRTAAIICFHIQVPNSSPDVGTVQSKAMSVCTQTASSLHTNHLSAWLWAHLWHVWATTQRTKPWSCYNVTHIYSLASCHLFFTLIFILFTFTPLLICFLSFSNPLASLKLLFLSHCFFPTVLLWFPYSHSFSTSLSLLCASSRDTCGDCVHNRSLIRFTKGKAAK